MAKYLVEDTSLIAIADAIRSKTNKADKLSLGEMVDAITELGSGGDTETSATLNALIDRSITEIQSDIGKIGSYAFYGCSKLATADFPLVTSINSYAFHSCSQLTTADFPVVSSLSNYAFYGCSKLATADFPVVTFIGANAFQDCSKLATADFPLVTTISNSAFSDCSELTTADFPLVTSINSYAFQNCSELTTADFPLVTSINSYAFRGCSKLTTADFPPATFIGNNAFQNCSQLNVVTLRSDKLCSLAAASAFLGTPIASGMGYIYVPSSLVDSYKSATNWSTYATQFRALEEYTIDGTITGELDADKIGA